MNQKKKKIRKYLYQNKGYIAVVLVFSVLSAIADAMIGFSLQKVAGFMTDMNIATIGVFALYVSACIIAYDLFYCAYSYGQRKLLYNINVQMKHDIFHIIMKKDYNEFTEKNSAEYISILNNDVSNLEENYFRQIPTCIMDVFLIAAGIIAIMYMNIWLAIVVFVSSSVLVWASAVVGKKVEKQSAQLYENIEDYNIKMKDYLSGFEVIKSFHADKQAENIFDRNIRKMEEARFRMREIQNPSMGILYGMTMFVLIFQMFVAGYLVHLGKMQMSQLLSLTIFASSVSDALRDITECFVAMSATRSNAQKVEEFLQEIEVKKEKTYTQVKTLFPIKIKDVSFSYQEEQYVLEHLQYTFEKGKKYALVGNSGCGKSTFAKILLKYYEDYKGSLTYGGQELRQLDRESVCRKIAVIHQKVFLFEDTIRNNITMFQDYTEQQIKKCAYEAGLQGVLQDSDLGLDTMVNESGQNFSGGEQQRIAIARAFLKRSDFIILDEATSNLDHNLSVQIERMILEKPDITVLNVTHKLEREVLQRYDEIIVMHQGHIVESGKFEELIKKEGYFYKLYNI